MNHIEIELKLTASNSTLHNIRNYKLFNACNWHTNILQNTYFDDVNFTLMRKQIALRIRDNGKQITQTLKISAGDAKALSTRLEFNYELTSKQLNLQAIKAHLPINASVLKPIFSTDFTRQSCTIEFANSIIELALDIGEVTTANKTCPISELELELIKGNKQDVIDLANLLQQTFTLAPCGISKAGRGFKLLNLE